MDLANKQSKHRWLSVPSGHLHVTKESWCDQPQAAKLFAARILSSMSIHMSICFSHVPYSDQTRLVPSYIRTFELDVIWQACWVFATWCLFSCIMSHALECNLTSEPYVAGSKGYKLLKVPCACNIATGFLSWRLFLVLAPLFCFFTYIQIASLTHASFNLLPPTILSYTIYPLPRFVFFLFLRI